MKSLYFLTCLASISAIKNTPPTGMGTGYACDESHSSFKFCDTTLSLEERVEDLVSRINVSDFASQLTARQSDALEELGVPSYYWGTNAIHGLQNLNCLDNGQCPTSFPAPCALGATFNFSLVEEMGVVMGRELRAYYNARVHNSLDTWSPTININRDPRWGRNVESPSEDPMIAGEYGAAYTRGLQQLSNDTDLVQTVVTLKHWLAYSIENYKNVTRYNVDVQVSAFDLASTYLVAWEKLIRETGALGIMCSYNAVNGLPTCANPSLNRTLRELWNFKGYITSDSDSCQCIVNGHPQGIDHFPSKPTNGTDATRQCLAGGTDINSGDTYHKYLSDGVESGEISDELARTALKNAFRMRFRLGLFDPDVENEYRKIPLDVVGRSQDLSLRAAKQSMVLLKNENILPFRSEHLKIAVIGQNVNNTMSMTGNYDGPLCPNSSNADCFPSIFQAISKINQNSEMFDNISDVKSAMEVAKRNDAVVLVVDNFADGGQEGLDRVSVTLSSSQRALVDAIVSTKIPFVLVLVNGGIISIDDLSNTSPAILEAFMPGVQGGVAIAETLFGMNNPGGKLPVTFYNSHYIETVDFLNMSMVNRTYRYYNGPDVIFPFGFGLSYSDFQIEWNSSSSTHDVVVETNKETDPIVLDVNVRNVRGPRGDEVVQVYLEPTSPFRHNTLIERRRLIEFQRISVASNSSSSVSFSISPSVFKIFDENGMRSLYNNSEFTILVTRGNGNDILKRQVRVVKPPADSLNNDDDNRNDEKMFEKWW